MPRDEGGDERGIRDREVFDDPLDRDPCSLRHLDDVSAGPALGVKLHGAPARGPEFEGVEEDRV